MFFGGNEMSNSSSFIDGRRLLVDSPFRSAHFLVVTVLGLAAVVLDLALLYWNRHSAHRFSLTLVLNAVHTNVWAILLVCFAVGLYHDGKDGAALAISTGAFTMLQAKEKSA